MARGVISVPLHLFKDLLLLLEDYQAVTAYYAHLPELVCLVVEHPGIPKGQQGRLTSVEPVHMGAER